MRPRKIVLLVDTNAFNLSVRSFVLHNWGYRPIKAQSAVAAMRELQDHKAYSFRLILIGDGVSPRSILEIAHRALDTLQVCPIYESGSKTDMYELRAGVKEKTSRKRGPREKAQQISLLERAA